MQVARGSPNFVLFNYVMERKLMRGTQAKRIRRTSVLVVRSNPDTNKPENFKVSYVKNKINNSIHVTPNSTRDIYKKIKKIFNTISHTDKLGFLSYFGFLSQGYTT